MKFLSFPLHVDIWLGNTFVAERWNIIQFWDKFLKYSFTFGSH